jgi:hypothetical protein
VTFFMFKGELIATDMRDKWFLLDTRGFDEPNRWVWDALTPTYGMQLFGEYKRGIFPSPNKGEQP